MSGIPAIYACSPAPPIPHSLHSSSSAIFARSAAAA
jgi:hypothetical protein